jgi:hypothetical protein
MEPASRKPYLRWLGIGVAVIACLCCAYVALNWSQLQARYTASQFRSASGSEAKTPLAEQLFARGEAAWPLIASELRSTQADNASVMAEVMINQLNSIPADDPKLANYCQKVIEESGSFSPVAKAKLLGLVPKLLTSQHPEAAARSRDLVRSALTDETATVQIEAIRFALRPEINLPADVVPLLKSPDAQVRRGAILALGPVLEDQTPILGTEELFPWLHDSDFEVRQLCRSALLTRGLDAEQIGYAQLLSDPRTTERLKLLADLRFATTTSSVGQWLERLSRDSDPAVRIGSARVASEMQLRFANWLTRLAEQDSDQLVRRWAKYYRQESERIKQTGYER